MRLAIRMAIIGCAGVAAGSPPLRPRPAPNRPTPATGELDSGAGPVLGRPDATAAL